MLWTGVKQLATGLSKNKDFTDLLSNYRLLKKRFGIMLFNVSASMDIQYAQVLRYKP
jgi:hypothetical protein